MLLTIVITYTAFMPLIATPEPTAGIVWLDRQPADMDALHAEWWYDYSVIDKGSPGFVPFFWCSQWPRFAYGDEAVNYFEKAERYLGHDYAGYLLFLNEPDLAGSDQDGGQCEMSPREGAYLYKAVLRDMPHARIVGPAVSHRDYWNNWLWLKSWYEAIEEMGLRPPEAAAIHTYIDSEPPEWIVDSLFNMLATVPNAPKSAWVTEFGSCNPGLVSAMIDTWQTHPRITRYAYFTARGWSPDCLNLFYSIPGYSLTPSGAAWVEAHR